MPVLPIDTERLHLRLMTPADSPVLAGYRNDPGIAVFQDWPMPYTVDMAAAMLVGQSTTTDLEPGEWVQVAVVHEGEVVGDIAVGLDDGGHVATLGYTMAARSQGKGFASEAAAAMVDAIFGHLDVHRIVATLDPQNHASMRVIEPLGFRREGLARRSEPIRGEWLDDLRFALLREDRAEWLARPCLPPVDVDLVELASSNLNAVCALSTFLFQERFVAPVARSLAQALVPPMYDRHPVTPWYRAVVADGEVVGFVMLSAATEWEQVPYLWRFLIDRRHQRRHIGERVIGLLADLARADGHASMLVSWVEAPGGPRRFYERLGFQVVGATSDGETEARLDLAPA